MSDQTAALPWRERLLDRAERRLPALTRRKQPEPLPVVLDRHRIYVLPTQTGLFFGGLLAAMLLGALNYNNNPALIVGFLLASAYHTALLHGWLSVRGVRLLAVEATPVHAGESLQLRMLFDAVDPRHRRGLVVRCGNVRAGMILAPETSAAAIVPLRTVRRGWFEPGRVELYSRHPLGLFKVWSWLNPRCRLLVYPAAETGPPPLPRGGEHDAARHQAGPGEHPLSLRDYRVGDPRRMVAWKRSAQIGRLLVREFERPGGREVRLDYHALGQLPREPRIRRLTAWVLAAERQGLRSTLLLPGQRLGPDHGPRHLHACLRALALLPTGADDDPDAGPA
ncbi:MAG TPA: DUF58 domain-containing protein [Xanthomonadaceae bacterium]|nr:DUF58 domain-containing protein [Xanthomonadaceae bacterium]